MTDQHVVTVATVAAKFMHQHAGAYPADEFTEIFGAVFDKLMGACSESGIPEFYRLLYTDPDKLADIMRGVIAKPGVIP